MKKYIILMLLVLVGSVTFAQLGGQGRTTVSKVTGLQDSLNLKLSIADTTAMLAPYLRVGDALVDTASLSNRIDLKLSISDTTDMLAPYLKTGEAVTDTASLSNRIDLKLNKADTASLSNRIDLKLSKADTVTLSNRINLKLNAADTASLSSRIDLKLNKVDTITLSNRIDLKLNKTDTTTLSSRIDLKADSTYLSNLSENVQHALDIRPDSLRNDAKYVLKSDSASIYDYVFSKAQSDSIYENQFFNFWKYNGFPKMLSLPFLSYTSWGSSQTMADGSLYVVLHKMNKDTVITKLNIFTFITGNYTGDNYNGMLVYTVNSTGITEVARTTNDTEIWKTAGSSKITKTLDTPVTVTKGQWIGIGVIYNNSAQTTAPQLPSMGSISANLFYQMTTTKRLVSVKTGVADPASSYTWGNLAVGTQLIGIWTE